MRNSICFFFSSRRRHTRCLSDWSSDVCSSDLIEAFNAAQSLPYRLASYQVVWTMLAALAVISLGRRVIGFDTATALRLLAAVALILLAMEIGRASCRERV